MLQKNALVKAKKAVEGLMNLCCDIYEYIEITEDSITRHERQKVHSNVPCRISYATGLFNGKLKSGQEKNSDGVSLQGTTVKMFFPKEVSIKEGSYIVVKNGSKTIKLKNTGATAEFQTHCEVVAEYVKEWA